MASPWLGLVPSLWPHATTLDSGAICLRQDVGADGVSLAADFPTNQPNPKLLGVWDL